MQSIRALQHISGFSFFGVFLKENVFLSQGLSSP